MTDDEKTLEQIISEALDEAFSKNLKQALDDELDGFQPRGLMNSADVECELYRRGAS